MPGCCKTWLHELLKVRLRKAVTFDLLDEWLQPRRVFQLKQSGDISTNPDQRIQDDARRLSELSVDLAVGLLQSSFLLIAFVGVLWQLSAQVKFLSGGHEFTIPGYMVWASIVYASLGSAVDLARGQALDPGPHRIARQGGQIPFRACEGQRVGGRDRASRRRKAGKAFLKEPADDLLATMRHIANRLAGLTWVTGGYGWLAIIAPLLLASPGYFGGSLTLGGLMMVVGGFYQVQTALRWYVDKFPVIAEWRAMLNRISSYRSALERLPAPGAKPTKIRYETGGACDFSRESRGLLERRSAFKIEDFKIEPRRARPDRSPAEIGQKHRCTRRSPAFGAGEPEPCAFPRPNICCSCRSRLICRWEAC